MFYCFILPTWNKIFLLLLLSFCQLPWRVGGFNNSFSRVRYITRVCAMCLLSGSLDKHVSNENIMSDFPAVSKSYYCSLLCKAHQTVINVHNNTESWVLPWWHLFRYWILVFMTTCGVTSDDKVGIMALSVLNVWNLKILTLFFLWVESILWELQKQKNDS